MDVKIDKDGKLLIKRKTAFVNQVCPFNSLNDCGHHCPFFDDPEQTESYKKTLRICHRKFNFNSKGGAILKDERTRQE